MAFYHSEFRIPNSAFSPFPDFQFNPLGGIAVQPDHHDYFQRKEWERREKQDHFKVAAGVMNFLGVVLGVVSILVLAALLISLLSWLGQDIASTFTILRTRFQ